MEISELKSELEEIQSLRYSEPSIAEKDDQLLSSHSDADADAGTDLTTNSRSSITRSAQPAAEFYYSSFSLKNDASSVLELCESVDRLNQYLKAAKVELEDGVPGKFLHAVIGQEAAGIVTCC